MKNLNLITILIVFLAFPIFNQSNLQACSGYKCGFVKETGHVFTDIIYKTNKDSILNLGKIVINRNQRTISFPVEINRADEYIEVILCTPEGKLHESLLVSDVKPAELQAAMILLGYKPLGNKISADHIIPELNDSLIRRADSFSIYIQWTDSTEKSKTDRIENFIYDNAKPGINRNYHWFFNGLLADENGKFISDEYYSLISTMYEMSTINVVLLLKPQYCLENNCNSNFKSQNLQKGKILTLIIRPD